MVILSDPNEFLTLISPDGYLFMVRRREIDAVQRDGLVVACGPDKDRQIMGYLVRLLAGCRTASRA